MGYQSPSLPYVYTVPSLSNIGLGIAATQSAKTPANVKWYYLDKESTIYLENGFIRNADDQNRCFDEPKDYYRPIPLQQIVLNPQLQQPYGW